VAARDLGPSGLALGEVQVVEHDGHGRVVVEDRPFLLMNDGARVELPDPAPARARPLLSTARSSAAGAARARSTER